MTKKCINAVFEYNEPHPHLEDTLAQVLANNDDLKGVRLKSLSYKDGAASDAPKAKPLSVPGDKVFGLIFYTGVTVAVISVFLMLSFGVYDFFAPASSELRGVAGYLESMKPTWRAGMFLLGLCIVIAGLLGRLLTMVWFSKFQKSIS